MRTFQIFFLIFCCIFSAVTVHAASYTCTSASVPASTPDSQLIDNNDGTVTDSKTGLMWKKCLEGASGDSCEEGTPASFTWQTALQQIETVRTDGGFAGYTDWRLPNIRELISIVEEQCYNPSINLNRFPNTPISYVWSSSPATDNEKSWVIFFEYGSSEPRKRYNTTYSVRLVRGGQ